MSGINKYPPRWTNTESDAVVDALDALIAAQTLWGTATVSAGTTETTVTHNKGVLNYPVISSCDELEGRDCWTEYVDVNSFKIHISMADLANDHIFNYHV